MPRHPRVHAEGLLYHVMARGNDGQKVSLRESDYQAFIEALRARPSALPVFTLRRLDLEAVPAVG
jgi:hypothetical protein